jgi:dienelactone hydrolase
MAAALAFPLHGALAADDAPPVDQRAAMAAALERQARIPDTAGSGPFAAIKEETASLPDHVVYRPAQLDELGPTKLGIYVFGNGACSNDGASARLHLLEIASHGYLAIAPGRIKTGPGATVPTSAVVASAPAQSTAPPPSAALRTSARDLASALDWALAQNADAKSPYFNRVDPQAVAVSGYSCGGLQALEIAHDPRIKTVVIMNSGIFNPGTAPIASMNYSKSLLDTLHTPTLYILGGKTDIAYANGMDDFARITRVPVFMGNVLNAGHGGTYWEPNGGKAAAAVVAWLQWQLRNDSRAAQMFVGKDCGLCRDAAWAVEKKKID